VQFAMDLWRAPTEISNANRDGSRRGANRRPFPA
jgi:hypothetical protein